ncbi:hypothetical protein [Flavobacterium rhizosphaerae]|uniref:PH domain-containing protein n=1 Tax=Flavobacterium rhizosphaerae TaxID=3163298 RepID=A0ABW8YX62_9FLAO
MTDFSIEKEFRPFLGINETVLWTGCPPKGVLFKKSDIIEIPLSIIWFGLVIFWETTVIIKGAPVFFVIFGILFICIGLYNAVGRFFYDAYRRNNIVYIITQQRILIKSGIFSKKVKSVSISDPKITFTAKKNGSGTILLGPDDRFNPRIFGKKINKTPRLEMIPEVEKVYKIIINSAELNLNYSVSFS